MTLMEYYSDLWEHREVEGNRVKAPQRWCAPASYNLAIEQLQRGACSIRARAMSRAKLNFLVTLAPDIFPEALGRICIL